MAKKLFLPLYMTAGMLLANIASGQTTYTLAQSSSAYQELSNATVINAGTNWVNTRYKVPVGFNFGYMGGSSDSIYIGTNGLLVFEKGRRHGFAAFLNMLVCKKDSAGDALSTVSYSTSGSNGSRIMKVQFKNCGMEGQYGDDHVSFQVWLYETNGKIEVRIGSSSVNEGSGEPSVFIGQVNNSGKGAPISGLTGTPASAQLQDFEPESTPPHMTSLPAEGTIYTFSR